MKSTFALDIYKLGQISINKIKHWHKRTIFIIVLRIHIILPINLKEGLNKGRETIPNYN